MLGLFWLLVIVVCAVFAPLIAPHDPAAQDDTPFLGLSSVHLLGTDELGRDVFSRLVYASQVALQAAFATVSLALVVSLLLGLTAGYVGNKFESPMKP